MTQTALHRLAESAGLSLHWRDAFGSPQFVSDDTLGAVLTALGLPAASEAQIAASQAALDYAPDAPPPPMLVTRAGQAAPVRPGARFAIHLEKGGLLEGRADSRGLLPAVAAIGYHRLELDHSEHTIAVAPTRCVSLADKGVTRGWGLAAQLYSLRRAGDGGSGDYAGLEQLMRGAARHRANAVAISPNHALFPAMPDRYSPYAPSSRVMLNALAAPAELPGGDGDGLSGGGLIDWPAVYAKRLAYFRRQFDAAPADAAFLAWRAAQDIALEDHARFDTLHAYFLGRSGSMTDWQEWPIELRDPRNAAVEVFAAMHAHEVSFHAWLQYRANKALAKAQAAALAAGMAIGLISDLAVGAHPGGGHAWSHQDEMLTGLSIGAPPDPLGPFGQDWGLAAFSPTGLRQQGYRGFLGMLRNALRHAGGVRIDHVMGLSRLWVIPAGARSADGVYLNYDKDAMLGLVALESARHDAVVIGEDLGTLPDGFKQELEDQALQGLRVLWFERDQRGGFVPPAHWSPHAVAMTSTHDTATLAGWWSGRDLTVREGLGLLPDPDSARAARAEERAALWRALLAARCAVGAQPADWDTWPFVHAAIAYLGGSNCDFALLPLEDALALEDQPNLPGTTDEHPNWRRRLPTDVAVMLDQPRVAARLARLHEKRRLAEPRDSSV
jgi:4-alpha-glucanotransferase